MKTILALALSVATLALGTGCASSNAAHVRGIQHARIDMPKEDISSADGTAPRMPNKNHASRDVDGPAEGVF